MSAVVFGGYGTFGTLVSRELARLGIPVVIAGRDAKRAEAMAAEMGRPHRGIHADVRDRTSCRAALQRQTIAVNCAGPFQHLGTELLEACLECGCHYTDIADDRDYVRWVRQRDEAFQGQGLVAAYGCSSLPGISGALAMLAAQEAPAPPIRARVTLLIGNNNPKGAAAVETLLAMLGQPIAAPQGILRGFRDREVVTLPQPFGARAVFNVSSPEYDLFPPLLGVQSVVVKVGFELRMATYLLALLARISGQGGGKAARLWTRMGSRFSRWGTSGGAVMSELFLADGSVRTAALTARSLGQVMAALPCAYAVEAICNGETTARGVRTAYELLGASTLLNRLTTEGFQLYRSWSASG